MHVDGGRVTLRREPDSPPANDLDLNSIPTPTSAPPPPKPIPSSSFLHTSHASILHLNSLLSHTSSLDALLASTSYTLALLSSLPLSSLFRLHTARSLSTTARPSTTPRIFNPTALAALLSETRTTLRLFGLIPLYCSLASFLSPHQPQQDPILRCLAALNIFFGLLFQVCENVAFLSEKGVVRGVNRKWREKLWRWSSRGWMGCVGCDLGRLGWVWWLRRNEEKIASGKTALADVVDGEVDGAVLKEREE
ncbi:MAG: hypothetical protein Q9220_003606 [cf. Caloplaca sp. 1 TL-2023]